MTLVERRIPPGSPVEIAIAATGLVAAAGLIVLEWGTIPVLRTTAGDEGEVDVRRFG